MNGINYFSLSDKYKYASLASFAFDAALLEIFLCLTAGGVLYLPPKNKILMGKSLNQFLFEQRIEVMIITPTVLSTILAQPLLSLKKLIMGGEKASPELIEPSLNQNIEL
jgi:non-ribosomal peptide synthetase component F